MEFSPVQVGNHAFIAQGRKNGALSVEDAVELREELIDILCKYADSCGQEWYCMHSEITTDEISGTVTLTVHTDQRHNELEKQEASEQQWRLP